MTSGRSVNFATHAELKNVIGQDLINDDNIAVIELVKNGLDAGSSNVTIEFRGSVSVPDEDAEIIFKDEGSGMTESDILGKWLNIAYSEKRNASRGSRSLAGNKGVGRFACDRLGRTLDIFTRVSGATVWQHVSIDWTQFEGRRLSNAHIQSIPVQLDVASNSDFTTATSLPPFRHGTVLRIRALRSGWDRQKLIGLKRYLSKFVEPNSAFDRASFSIDLQVPEQAKDDRSAEKHEKISGKVENQIFDKLKFHTAYIQSEVSGDGDSITTELHHNGRRVYRIVEKNEGFELLAGTKVLLHYMNPYQKGYFKKQTGLNAVEFGSVFLFLNGYRVPPYGDRDNDWLRLDSRKAQGFNDNLGSRELLGRIEITDQGGRFRVVSNREGIARGAAFLQLVGSKSDGFFYRCLKRLEKFVVNGLGWDSLKPEDRKLVHAGTLPKEGSEIYLESLDTKRRRIAMDIVSMLSAKPSSTISLSIDPTLFDSLKREREEEVAVLLERVADFGGTVDQGVKKAVNSLAEEVKRQKLAVAAAEKSAQRSSKRLTKLREAARGVSRTSKELKAKVATQQKELMFARSSRDHEKDELMMLHHHSGIYASTAKNNVANALESLQEGDQKKAQEYLAKVFRSLQQIQSVTTFATKIKFRPMAADKVVDDLAGFIEGYVANVVSNHSTAITIRRDFAEPFKLRFRPFDVAIVIDNLVNNARSARHLSVEMTRPVQNELQILFKDDGPGLSKKLQPPEAAFELGVTTTAGGTGMGLFHVRQIVNEMKGKVSIENPQAKGFSLSLRFFS